MSKLVIAGVERLICAPLAGAGTGLVWHFHDSMEWISNIGMLLVIALARSCHPFD